MVRPKNINQVRVQALQRAKYKCEWSKCKEDKYLKLITIEKIGTMGRDSTKAYEMDNVAMFCSWHADLYNNRQAVGWRRAFVELMQNYLELKRNAR